VSRGKEKCPTPGKVGYGTAHLAHQAQPGAKKAGMRPYQCVCKRWHWGHPRKKQKMIASVIAEGNRKQWEMERRRAR
jgi:hypothetical protein